MLHGISYFFATGEELIPFVHSLASCASWTTKYNIFHHIIVIRVYESFSLHQHLYEATEN